MRRKRILAAALAVLLALPLSLTGIGSGVKAENKNNERYYYNQLNADAKGIYDAMYAMYDRGIFKTGKESYDLVANGHITSSQLAAYGGRQTEILKVFGAARDAFYADYPDIFYVDFSSLSISVTEKAATSSSVSDNDTAVYGASLGTGGTSTYYVQGFTSQSEVESAIKEHESKIDAIVQGAKKQSSSVREQVIYVNNEIIKATTYTSATGSNEYVRTSYGALVKGQSLCEGYARAVKTVLDAMGIKSVLVQGSYRAPDGSDNLHMWNYVQIDGKWYGLDATANDGMQGGTDSTRYLLADKTVMGQNHSPGGIMSESGFRFTYPQLAAGSSAGGEESPGSGNTDSGNTDSGNSDSGEYKTVFEESGLLVEYRDGTEFEEETGIFKVSYKGMGYQEAVDKEQVYILSRFYQFRPGTGDYAVGNWGYSDPKPFTMPQLKDALVIANGNSKYIEFAITKKAPAGPLYGEDLSTEELEKNWNFQGTEADFIVSTGKLENPRGNFVPAPFAGNITPSNTGYITCGVKYHVKAEFNEELETYDGQEAGYELTVKDGWSAIANSKIENLKWDKKRTVEFDFTTSPMLADNYAVYNIQITGLRGIGSLKVPDSFTYSARRRIAVCSYRPQGIYLTVGAKPVLLEPGDLSYNGWQTSDGKKLVDVVDRIKLVASKPELEVADPSKQQTGQMIDQIKGQLDPDAEIMASATYDLRLTCCNHNIIQTGNSVRLLVGFPENFSPDEGEVTYKAYHFRTGADGSLIAEEISCITTAYGLMITCNAFSPYAIVAVKDPEEAASVSQKLLVMNSAGGEVEIQGAEGDLICELKEQKETRTISIKAKEGYSISRIYLSDKKDENSNVDKGELRITNSKSMNLTIRYEDLAGCNNILDVTFAADKPKQETSSTTPQKNSPSGSDAAGTQQQNTTSSQNNGSSGNGQSGSSGSNSTGNPPAKTESGNGKTQEAPQGQSNTPAEPAAQEKTASAHSSAATSSSGSGAGAGTDTGAGLFAFGQDAGSAEDAMTVTENSEQLASPPVATGGIQEITEADLAGGKSGFGGILGTIVISVAGAGVIVGGIAGYVKLKRKWIE